MMENNILQFACTIETRFILNEYLYDPSIDYRITENAAWFGQKLGFLDYEVMLCLFLDPRGRMIGTTETRGTRTSVPCLIREIAKTALLCGAIYVTPIHNHPSIFIDADLTFSSKDLETHNELEMALKLFGILISDDVIISLNRFSSLNMQEKEQERKNNLSPYDSGKLAVISKELPKINIPASLKTRFKPGNNISNQLTPMADQGAAAPLSLLTGGGNTFEGTNL